ncbi:MAG: hypothetical protein Fues2KO_25180 [Fuerstiella sp.]
MTPHFAKSVDPIFLAGVDLIHQATNGTAGPPEQEQLRIRALFEQAEAELGAEKEWELAKYALVSWIDEVLVDTPWAGQDWWRNNVLEVHFFNTRLCNEQFFLRAKEASTLSRKNAQEVYYDCVVLGFRGLYRDEHLAEQLAPANDLPPTLDEWARQVSMSIRLGQGRPPLSSPTREIPGAPPLPSNRPAVIAWVVAALLLIANAIFYATQF